jgi:Glycosyl hydrolase family 99
MIPSRFTLGRRAFGAAIVSIGVVFGGAAAAQTRATTAVTNTAFPIRAAFYYPWFPEAWNQQGFNPFTNYTPSLGFYDSSASTTLARHIAAMQYAGLQAGIASWWGQGSKTDSRVPLLLAAGASRGFKWMLYYELEASGDPSVAQLGSDLSYIAAHYAGNAAYLHVNGKPVIFVYASAADACGMADRWTQANAGQFYVVLKAFAGYKLCAHQPDSWHQYAPAIASDSQPGYSFSLSPGFWKKGDAVRLGRNPATFASNAQRMLASHAPWQLVTTFNEWGEGTAVESAWQWASASGYGTYLDILHTLTNHSAPSGYWMIGSAGQVYPFGSVLDYGSPSRVAALHLEPTPTRRGYWILGSGGQVYSYGDAPFLGVASRSGFRSGEHVTTMSATPSGRGYWIFTSAGRVLRFGDAGFYGDMTRTALKGPVVGSVATPSGRGYYMVGSDGGVFAFGDARYHGSTGAMRLNRPIVALVPTANGGGYWLVAADGGVFAFAAPYKGSTGNIRLNRPIVGMVRYGDGYLMAASDGGVFDFSTKPYLGSLATHPPANPIVGIAAT